MHQLNELFLQGLAQPAYVNNSNWFTEPYLPNNDRWVQDTAWSQMINNQQSYPARGWETYPPGLYNISRYAQPINDYDPNNLPSWTPIAGGKGSSLKSSGSSWNSPGSSTKASAASPSSSAPSSPNSAGSSSNGAGLSSNNVGSFCQPY